MGRFPITTKVRYRPAGVHALDGSQLVIVIGMQNVFVNLFVPAKLNMESERNRLPEILKFFGFILGKE